MKVRSCLLLLLVAIGWAGAAEPKARPRLTPPVVSEVKREAARPALDAESAPSFGSFDDYLQAQARQPVGLEALPEVAAARSASAGTKKEQAAKDSPPPPPRPRPDATGGEVLVLPKMEINAERMTKLKDQLAALEANQSWETSSAEAWDHLTVVDAILNPPFLKLGGYSGAGRAALARRRVEMLRWVKILSISLEEAKTPADKARIQADIDAINGITRMWE